MMNRVHLLGLAVKAYAYAIPEVSWFRTSTGANSDGLEFIGYPPASETSSDYQHAYAEYVKRYPDGPNFNFFLISTYDAVRSLSDGIEAVGPDPLKLKAFLHSYRGLGALGAIEYDEAGDLKNVHHVLKRFKSDGSTEVIASLAENKEKLKIGVMLCQSGNCADWGSAALKGAELAKERVNASGGVLEQQLELVVEDSEDSISGARAVSAFQSLLAKKINFFIGPSWAPAALAIAPIAAKRTGIIILTPSASERAFSRAAPHIFNLRPPEELATRALARYAYSQGKRRAAIFSSQQPAVSTQGKIFEDEFKKLGGEVTMRIEPIPTLTDLRTEALTLVRTSPDVIFLMNYNQLETGIRDLNNLGYHGMKMAISLDGARIASTHGLLDGVVVGRAAEPTEAFRREFKNRFGEAPGLSAEGGYDAVISLAQALKDSRNVTVAQVRDRLQHGNFSGAIGAFSFDENREVVQAPVLFVVKDGKLSLL